MSTRTRWVLGLSAATIATCYAIAHVGRSVGGAAPLAPQAELDLAAPAGDAKAILSRVWFDKLPEKRNEEVTIAMWFAGGIGIYERGSYYRSAFELFEFERRGSRVDMTFLQDKKQMETAFEVKRCDEKPPFDLCLTFANAPRGQKTLYGFSRDQEEAAAVPWSRELLKAARARATTK